MKRQKIYYFIDKITSIFEIAIAFALLLIIAIKVIEVSSETVGFEIAVLTMEFERILSVVLALVIGVEFTKMLCKHTPESVIDVLLFAIARQMVIYHDSSMDLLIAVAAIVGLFAAKKYLADRAEKSEKNEKNEKINKSENNLKEDQKNGGV